MSMANPGSVGCSRGMAVVRAAEAMIQALGGEEVTVLFPVVALPDDPAAQLGLADPGVQEVAISPVVVRNLRAETKGTRVQYEFLIPAPVVSRKAENRQAESVTDFFNVAIGIAYAGHLLRIEAIDTEFFAGTAYLYRISAGE
jgi:hypothetical protein